MMTGCNWLDVLVLVVTHLLAAIAARYGIKLPPLPFPQQPAPTPPAQTPSVPEAEKPPEKPAEKVPENVANVRRS